MGSIKSDPPKKPKKRSRTRKVPTHQDRDINLAEVRREISLALQLLRSSSTPKRDSTLSGDGCNDQYGISYNHPLTVDYSDQYCCYSLLDTLPTPEPVWSTTAPSVLASSPAIEAPEFDWGDNVQAATYNWWLGFLKSLDGNIAGPQDFTCEDHKVAMGDSSALDHNQNASRHGEDSNEQGLSADEWLIFPPFEDQTGN
ncbi:hypothetical protein Tsubulata_031081 [Turnera subulata]|uniref:Uncharacterized protein n=1 Tax=Turnera subulata TaxID=218843 RepID=A0A9Q0JI68_9ROSI|nr:hypothetical protein Tsubulata_031081 [Turnera subulata]